jgi:hypothetical protein
MAFLGRLGAQFGASPRFVPDAGTSCPEFSRVNSDDRKTRARQTREEAKMLRVAGRARIVQGGHLDVTGLSKIKHLFQCCIRPWMRTEVDVK